VEDKKATNDRVNELVAHLIVRSLLQKRLEQLLSLHIAVYVT